MSKTQIASHEGTSSDPKVPPNRRAYESDDADEDEMLEALIRSEMGDGSWLTAWVIYPFPWKCFICSSPNLQPSSET